MNSRTPIRGQAWLAGRRKLAAASALSMQVTGAALSFLATLLVAKLIGVTGLGLFFLSITVVEIGATVARLGLEGAALKSIAIARDSDDRAMMATLYRRCAGIGAVSAIVTALLACLLAHLISTVAASSPDFLAQVPLLAYALVPVTLLPIQTEALKATGRPAAAAFFQTVFPQGMLLLFSAVLAWHGLASIKLILTAYALAFSLAVVASAIRWASIVEKFWLKSVVSSRALLQTSMPMLAVSSLNLAMAWTDTLALGLFSSADQVGLYGVALRIASTTAFVLTAANSVVAPEFAALHAGGRHADLERLVQRSAFWVLIVASPMILVFLVFPAEILSLFGEPFVVGSWPLRILALAQLVNAATGQVVPLLIMTGHANAMRNNLALAAVLNVAGNLALVPSLGALGAAISTAFCIALTRIVAWRHARHKLGIGVFGYLNLRAPRSTNEASHVTKQKDTRSRPN